MSQTCCVKPATAVAPVVMSVATAPPLSALKPPASQLPTVCGVTVTSTKAASSGSAVTSPAPIAAVSSAGSPRESARSHRRSDSTRPPLAKVWASCHSPRASIGIGAGDGVGLPVELARHRQRQVVGEGLQLGLGAGEAADVDDQGADAEHRGQDHRDVGEDGALLRRPGGSPSGGAGCWRIAASLPPAAGGRGEADRSRSWSPPAASTLSVL